MNRVREQVETFVAYGGYEKNMSVGEILDKSRADRLIKKELEKCTSGIISDMIDGKLDNKIVTLPEVDWQADKYNIRGPQAIEIAKDIEQSFKIFYSLGN